MSASSLVSSTDPRLHDVLTTVRARLEKRLGRTVEADSPVALSDTPRDESLNPLGVLVSRFTLSAFERDVLVLCAGVELDASFSALVTDLQRVAGGPAGPTFGLALAALDAPHWSALSPESALRRWRLIELVPDAGVTAAQLRIDERVLHFLAGVGYPEPRLSGLVEPLTRISELAPSQLSAVRNALDAWSGGGPLAVKPVIILAGTDTETHEALAGALASALEFRLHRLRASALPTAVAERVTLARLWERESMLMRSVLLVVVGSSDDEETRERARLFVDDLAGLTLLSTVAKIELRRRPSRVLPISRVGVADQLLLWRRELGPAAHRLNGAVERVASQFELDPSGIRRAARATLSASGDDPTANLWEACRAESRTGLEGLAQKIEPLATWSDLVLPEAQLHVLRTMVAQVRQRAKISEAWGFARKGTRGLGVHALFAGPSGTGKTLAAEVIAAELSLDLHRIDLSVIVSKYIGETEKNLRRVFDAAERGGSILLFDEADALFGRRSEVKDSHDRYANIEVSYLLQRIESYRGLAILTTNLKTALDPAFARRLRFTVHFPFPDQQLRAQIWRRIFPAETPLDGVDFDKVARLSLSGGHIRNLALNAAYLAADAGEPVRMRHLLAAAQAEYAKLEKPFSHAETAGWL